MAKFMTILSVLAGIFLLMPGCSNELELPSYKPPTNTGETSDSDLLHFEGKAEPIDCGNNLVKRFLEIPNSNWGRIDKSASTFVTYPDVCAWLGAFWYAEAAVDNAILKNDSEAKEQALGLIQGLTEYLPVSSSGHLAIGSALFGIEGEENLAFTIVVHVATVFSTLVILWKEIEWIFRDLFKFQMNAGTRYAINIVISMIPVGIIGVFFKDTVEDIFGAGLLIVGCMLLLTAALLTFSYYAKPRQKTSITLKDDINIGLSQACDVMPGLYRSGTTIATGHMLGNNKPQMAQFSFLMVIPPILGEALLDTIKAVQGEAIAGDIPMSSLLVGFLAAFLSGCLACKWMINIVKKGKLIYFAIYCALAGAVTIICSLLN